MAALPSCKEVAPNFPAFAGGCSLEVSGSACYSTEQTYKVPDLNQTLPVQWACSPSKELDNTITNELCQARTWSFNNSKIHFVAPKGIYAGACLLTTSTERKIPTTHIPASASLLSGTAFSKMKCLALFDTLAGAVKAKGPEFVKIGGAVFQFVLSDFGPEGKFILDLKNGSGDVKVGEAADADVTLTMTDADMFDMYEGKLDGMQAFMTGKLKLEGNIMLAEKLPAIRAAAQ